MIEWENALDARDKWVRLALSRLEAEIEAIAKREPPPPVFYIYDKEKVEEGDIVAALKDAAPKLLAGGGVRLIPSPGYTYYLLKNYGAQLAETPVVIFLDSDAGPLPGWYDSLMKELDDPSVTASGGMTTVGTDGLLSRAIALTWFFPLSDEEERARQRQHVHANNLAIRRDFFLQHPFPTVAAFKQAHVVWQRGLRGQGVKIPVTPAAKLVHAPPDDLGFLFHRAWLDGGDRDFAVARRIGPNRLLRFLLAPAVFCRVAGRGLGRIVTLGHRVGLRPWAMPGAMAISLVYNAWATLGQMKMALTRSHRAPVPADDKALLGVKS